MAPPRGRWCHNLMKPKFVSYVDRVSQHGVALDAVRRARKEEKKARELGADGSSNPRSPSKPVGGAGLKASMAPWSKEAKEMAKIQNQCKQLLAGNTKLKKAQSQQAAGNMEVDEDEDGDNVA
eukprot:9304724-Pyramimonas_sp.AAC.1